MLVESPLSSTTLDDYECLETDSTDTLHIIVTKKSMTMVASVCPVKLGCHDVSWYVTHCIDPEFEPGRLPVT